MSTTVTDPTPQGPEEPRNGRPQEGPAPAGTRPGSWAYALAGMDCYGYGLGYDYWTALHGAGREGDPHRAEVRRSGEAAAPRSHTGRTVALAIGGLVAAAAVGAGLVLGLGGHSATPAATPVAAATTGTRT
ncbi:hypothetical protein GCM10023215_22610 [Pseudonocardia yuanmonensis]|uniref:Uncharacterized protein n=1 Tax=Pseudonocardia yuanmonensis TaxID=1095914 RepID=A0ABP8WCF5_9PSEU